MASFGQPLFRSSSITLNKGGLRAPCVPLPILRCQRCTGKATTSYCRQVQGTFQPSINRRARERHCTPLSASKDDEVPVENDESEAAASRDVEVLTDDEEEGLPYERLLKSARKAAESGDLNEEFLAHFLDKADAQFKSLQEGMDAAEARAVGAGMRSAGLESALQTSKEQFVRLTADFDNYRKRTGNEKAALADTVKGDVVKQLVPLVDSFESAQKAVKAESESEKKIDSSYQGIYKQMVETFKALGVTAVAGVGEPFDPAFHDAIMREANNEVPDGTVLQEFRRGFRLGETLLRPSMVKVSFTEDAPAEGAAPGAEEAQE